MIEPKELRTGNVIVSGKSYPGQEVIVDGISADAISDEKRTIWFKGKVVGEHACDCVPIQLTEKWLIEFGFVHNDHWWHKGFFEIGYITSDDNYQFDWYRTKVIDLQYVHQLQNLYFALTGEELTIKNG